MRLTILFEKHPDTLWAKAICWWTGGPHFHAAMMLDDEHMLDPPMVCEATDHGVRWSFPKLPLDPQHWDMVPVKATQEQIFALRDWANKEVGCKYDWFGMLLVQVFGIRYRSKDRWYCSELVAAGLKETGIRTGEDPVAVDPNDLYEIVI